MVWADEHFYCRQRTCFLKFTLTWNIFMEGHSTLFGIFKYFGKTAFSTLTKKSDLMRSANKIHFPFSCQVILISCVSYEVSSSQICLLSLNQHTF